MNVPTSEEVRAAASVVGKLFDLGYASRFCLLDEEVIEGIAERIEREQAEEAKRDKRVEELAQELTNWWWGDAVEVAQRWREMATLLVDRYPSLLDEDSGR